MKYREALFDDKIQDNFTTNLFIMRNRQQNTKPKSAQNCSRVYRPPAHVSRHAQGSKDVATKQEMNGIVNKFLTQVRAGGLIDTDDLEEDC
jgi:hypothetical protein